jgi:hypothetical protein
MNQIALIEKTRSLIAAGDISGAEAALADLADTEGDGALMVVLEQLQPKDILAVIREYDNSKDSVINLLVTPAQFARAVVIEKQYKDLTRTHLRGMMNAVIFREDADPIEFLTRPSVTSKAAARRWPTIFPRSGAASRPLPARACSTRSRTTARSSPRPRCAAPLTPARASSATRWPTRTGWSWPGSCATSCPTCSSRCCWCCVPRPAPMTWAWMTRRRKRTTARSTWPTPTAAAPLPVAQDPDEESRDLSCPCRRRCRTDQPLPLPPSRCTMHGRSSKRRCITACSTA